MDPAADFFGRNLDATGRFDVDDRLVGIVRLDDTNHQISS